MGVSRETVFSVSGCLCGETHRVPVSKVSEPVEWWHSYILGPSCIIPVDAGPQIARQCAVLRRTTGIVMPEDEAPLVTAEESEPTDDFVGDVDEDAAPVGTEDPPAGSAPIF